ncbi:MAG: hypothetical protein C7B46_03490 [Sulfobacillus benefaciens]|uniref:ACT domain-containing protein n=1 Tax=Sulfobacillus benefaciens TaxID=453960 RepID=A0A2T2XJW4_9FIRM|nr:MAG: hypothetical protein C7B46_03490 [Sulfobacillus benefaciens]
MSQTIRVEMQDGFGAIQRLLVLLGQRSIAIEHLAVQFAPQNGSIVAHLGIAGDTARAHWVMRQISRHKDVIAVYMLSNQDVNTWAEVRLAPFQEVLSESNVTVLDRDHEKGHYRIMGSEVAVNRWVAAHQGQVESISQTGLWPSIKSDDKDIPSLKSRGGIDSERKIVLRRQRRSRVVSR